MTEDPAAVALSDVGFAWPGGRDDPEPFRLEIADWRVSRGERLALIGPSGSGKTTLLNLLAGVVVAERGVVRVLGSNLTDLSATARDRFRGDHIGLIFQMFNLLPFASVLENVLLPLRFSARRREAAGPEAEEEGRRLLERLGLDRATFERRPVSALSVGQQQRVAAARALIGAPELIIADEPTSALDPDARGAFLDLLFSEAERSGATLLTVTHDPAVAERFDRATKLKEILRKPAQGEAAP